MEQKSFWAKFKKYLPYIVIVILIVMILNYHYYGPFEQRRWPVPKIKPTKEFILLFTDKIMDASKLFNIEFKKDPDYVDIFDSEEERASAKDEAIRFFKKQYGFSDLYLKLFLKRVMVNDESEYNVNYIKDKRFLGAQIRDGGYVVLVPPYTKITGRYGGKNGVVSSKMAIIPFGYYKFGKNNEYQIKYFAMCPLTFFRTYDGQYSIIDCDIEMTQAPDQKLIGLKGKAQGMYKKMKVKNGLDRVVIRNVLVFT